MDKQHSAAQEIAQPMRRNGLLAQIPAAVLVLMLVLVMAGVLTACGAGGGGADEVSDELHRV